MNLPNFTRLAILAAGLLAVPLVAAIGTPAGTSITNRAFVDYQDANGNPLTRVTSNTVTTVVTQVAGVAIAPDAATSAASNGQTVYFDFDIRNTGNGSDSFSFGYELTSGWTPTSVTFYVDTNDNGILDAGDTEITGSGPYDTGPIPADGHLPILMAVVIPDATTAPDTETSVLTVTTTSAFDPGVSATGTYTTQVAAAVISALKSYSSTPNPPVPGTEITYTIVLSNSGSVIGTAALATDPIPAGLTYVPGSITLDAVAMTDADDLIDDVDFGETTPNTLTADLGDIAASTTMTLTFKVTVDANLAAGTGVQNLATVTYNSGGTPVTQTSNAAKFTVATAPDVTITTTATTATANPGDKVTFPLTITNTGNASDVIDLTYSSTTGLTYALWIDANGDGIAGNDGDTQLTDTDGDGTPDTGTLPAGTSLSILAVATVPAGTSNGTVETLQLTGTSSNDPTVSDGSGPLTTTVTAPVLSLFKEVSPAGDQPPGSELTYTVTATNIGSGLATSVVISDPVPTFTTFKTGSILTGSSPANLTSRTDAADGDGGTHDASSRTVTGTATSVGAGGSLVLRFTVTID